MVDIVVDIGSSSLPRLHSPAMPIQAAIFDLDGTLADTLEDIAAAGNHVREVFDLPALPTEAYRFLAGQGLTYLIRHALGETLSEHVPQGIEQFHRYYAAHRYDHSGPYPGIHDLLSQLASRGITLAVLSNKPDTATQDMVRQLLSDFRFAVVRGHREPMPLKPDPAAANAIARQLGLPEKQCAYIGDTKVDMLTGKRAGMFTVGVTWGFREETELRENGADAIIHEPGELIALVS